MSQVINNSIPLPVESGAAIRADGRSPITVFGSVITIITLLALIGGLQLRYWAWEHSEGLRFNGDVENAYHWGSFVAEQGAKYETDNAISWAAFWRGYVNAYDAVQQEALQRHHEYHLDYTPLRLLVMSLWARDSRASDPSAQNWKPVLTGPLLTFNILCELASCLAIFFLVWHWRGRTARAAVILALIGALLAWFDPSVILDDHVWPQWDVWLLPFYLWPAFCCSTNRWSTAGFLLAIGAMLQRQVLTIAPVFALWAIFEFEFVQLLKLVGGLAAGVALVVAPFLVQSAQGAWCVAGATVAAALIAFPLMRKKSEALAIAAGVFAVMVFVVGMRYGGSWGWYRVGFVYPIDHFQTPAAGTMNNLPAIFGVRFGWHLYDPVVSIFVPWSSKEFVVTFQLALRVVYFLLLILCGIGLAIQARRKSPAALIGFAAPWVIMFAFTPQMHCRYLIWGSVATALCVGVSAGLTLLHFVVAAMSAGMFLHTMLAMNPETSPRLLRVLQGMEPDLGWVMALVALIYLYVLMTPGEPAVVVQERGMERETAQPAAAGDIAVLARAMQQV